MSTRRAYRSDLRSNQAVQTRLAIRAAARELFEEKGFTAATVAQIAARAGVSNATVYATFGSKAALLREMMDELEVAAGGDAAAARLFAQTDPHRQLAAFVDWIRTLFEQGETLFRAARAARGDEEVEVFIATGNERRLEGCRMLVAGWKRAGALRPGLSRAKGAESLWLLTSAELYLSSTATLGWSADAYEAWLLAAARHALFGDEPTSTAGPRRPRPS